MKQQIHVVYECVQHSLGKIREDVAWIELFEEEQRRGATLSRISLEHVGEDLSLTVESFLQQFEILSDLVGNQRGKAREQWERDSQKAWKAFKALLEGTGAHHTAPKVF